MRRQRRHAAPTPYVYRDEFLTTRTGGSVNNTPCDPGPGTRVVNQGGVAAGQNFTVNAGDLNLPACAAEPETGDDMHERSGESFARQPGRTLFLNLQISASTGTPTPIAGWWSAVPPTTSDVDSIVAILTSLEFAIRPASGSYGIYGTGLANTYYRAAQVLRTNGAFCLSDFSGAWKLRAARGSSNITPMYVGVIARSSTLTSKIGFYHVVDGILIQAICSDSFASNGNLNTRVMDGLETPEGSRCNLPWTVQSGTWATAGGVASASVAGIATFDLGTPDAYLEIPITMPAAGVTPFGFVCRYTDADNLWYIKITPGTAGTDFQLIERNAGVETPQATADIDWIAGQAYTLQVCSDGTSYWKAYVDGTEQLSYTTTNAFNQTATVFGIRDEGAANASFGSVQVWACGSEGQYAFLGRYL